jgi:hypothetical protein
MGCVAQGFHDTVGFISKLLETTEEAQEAQVGRRSLSLTLVPQLHSWRLVRMRTYVKGHAPCRQGNGGPLTILALTRKGRCPGFTKFHKQAVLPQCDVRCTAY